MAQALGPVWQPACLGFDTSFCSPHALLSCSCSKSRSLNVQQPPCQLDPNLLLKQQLHQPAMKSFLENVVPHHASPELPKGPSQINAFSNFPIGGFSSQAHAFQSAKNSSCPWPSCGPRFVSSAFPVKGFRLEDDIQVLGLRSWRETVLMVLYVGGRP